MAASHSSFRSVSNVLLKRHTEGMVVVHTFKSQHSQEAEAVDLCEFKASLVFRVNSRKARETLC